LGRKLGSKLKANYIEHTSEVLNGNLIKENDYHIKDRLFSLYPNNLTNYLMDQINYYSFNQILHYEDMSSMSSSIEMRSPYIDYRLMEYSLSLPNDYKLSGDGKTKNILKEAYKNQLPSKIINQKKIGFNTPFQSWAQQNELNDYIRSIFKSESFQNRTSWNGKMIFNKFLEENKENPTKFPYWRFINAELWARSYNIINI